MLILMDFLNGEKKKKLKVHLTKSNGKTGFSFSK